jgi:hypothetical protein
MSQLVMISLFLIVLLHKAGLYRQTLEFLLRDFCHSPSSNLQQISGFKNVEIGMGVDHQYPDRLTWLWALGW